MNEQEKLIARIMFRLSVYESNGSAFEELFKSIMEKVYKDFVRIKPQGRIGDRKNDGYVPRTGCYYQVYAPENPKDAPADAVNKLKEDFAGLKTYWDSIHPIRQWHFVFNDKYLGVYPTILQKLAQIQKDYGLDACTVFLPKNLEDHLLDLQDNDIFDIVGIVPNNVSQDTLDFSLVNEVISFLMKNPAPVVPNDLLTAPDFHDKIVFNGLSDGIGVLLTNASYQTGILDKYFSLNSTFAKQELRNKLAAIYLEAKSQSFGDVGNGITQADYIFFHILKLMTPKPTKPVQDAALTVMAYYFETCDIFEDPKGAKRSAIT